MSTPIDIDISPPSFLTLPISTEEEESQMANLALIFDRYKDKFENLPKEKGWISENLYLYEGFWHPSKLILSIETVMALQETFRAHQTDIYLATLPKSGTTWIKALTFAIVNRNMHKISESQLSTHPLRIYSPHNCVPFIDIEVLRTKPNYVEGYAPRIFAAHIPYISLPRSIIDSGCRIVYMCRNPKDVLVSQFHFANKLRDKSRGPMTFTEGYEKFSKGVTPYGPYWDHVKGYYKASLEHPTRILFLTYEDMNKDVENNVKRLAEFLGYPFTEEEEEEGVVDQVVRLCSFESLVEVNKHGNHREGIPKNVFFREGKVGDWNNYLTDEMNQILDQITKEQFHGLDLSF